MSVIRTLLARLRSLRRGARRDQDLDDELRGYVESLVARHVRDGLSPEAARRAALVETGGIEQVKEEVRHVQVGHAVTTLVRDLRYGTRVLLRAPGYASVVILTIALGIGVNVTMFAVLHTVLWRSLPYPQADRLVAIEIDAHGVPSAYAQPGESLDLRAQSRLLASISTINGVDASLTVDDVMERVAAASVTDEVLPMLGATPLPMGRTLINQQDQSGDFVSAVVISHDLWQRRFHGDPAVIGRHLQVNNIDVQVVGVTRPGFRVYLPAADRVDEHVDVWFPTGFDITGAYRGYAPIARLAPGATLAQAQAEVDAITAGFVATHPGALPGNRLRIVIRPLADVVTREARPALLALGAAVCLVLLIACVNVANLMLARTKARERELAVRRALGATRFRLVRQLLAEALVIAAAGGLGGWLLAQGGIALLEWLRPSHLPRQSEITIDGVMTIWTAAVALVSSLFFGLFPALSFTGDAISRPLTAGRSGTMHRNRRLQRGLVIAEVALSIAPLLAAGLMLRTFVNLTQAPIGFDPANVLTARVPLSFRLFPDDEHQWAFHREVIERVRQIPGVEAASEGGPLPFTAGHVTRRYWPAEDPNAPRSIGAQLTVLPGFLHVMGIPLLTGRDITADDISLERPVVIVDSRMAAELWRGDALGRKLALERGRKMETLEVIGVAAPIRTTRVRDAAEPTIFVPYHVYGIDETLVVKTREPIATIGPVIKQTVEGLGTGRPMFDMQSMTTIISSSLSETRFTMLVLVGFAAAALLLAAVGLFGTLAYLISQRTQEFGLRIALGASTADVIRLVTREGGALTLVGSAIGFGAAAVAARALRGLLYGVTPLDTVTIAGVVAIVAAVAMVAIGRPAWRASRVDPCTALRND